MEWNELIRGQGGDIRALMRKEGAKGRYARITISLATAQSDELLNLTGDYIGVASITGDGTCKMRLDHRHAQQIDLREVEEISSPFGKVYFETDGAGGSLVIYVGGALTARLKPVQSKVSLRSTAGVDIDPVQDKRFKAHALGQIDMDELETINDAEPISGTDTTPVSLKVRWAIVNVYVADCLFGDSTLTNLVGAHPGVLVGTGSSITVEHCDLKDLYVVNEDGAVKPKFATIYTTEA